MTFNALTPSEKTDLYTQKVQVNKNPPWHISFDFASWLIADAKYTADYGEESYFKSPYKRVNFVERAKNFCKHFKIPKEKIKISYQKEENAWVGTVSAFSYNTKNYKVRFPRVENGNDKFSIMKNGYLCSCPRQIFLKTESEWPIDKHEKILGNLLRDLKKIASREIFGSDSEVFKENAGVINDIGRKEDYNNLSHYLINDRRIRRVPKLKQIVNEHFWDE